MTIPTSASGADANQAVTAEDATSTERSRSSHRAVERLKDRAAVHAAPRLIAIRDGLLVALAFSSGIYEAICYLSFGKVFTAFQTGNLVLLGVIADGTRPPAGPDRVSVVVSLVAFAAGAALAVRILKAFDGDEEVDDENVFQAWPRRVSIALGVTLVAQLAFLTVWLAAAPAEMVSHILLTLGAFGAGVQMNAIRSLHVPGVSTTAATATYISWVSGIATWSHTAPAARRLTGTLVGMVVGAFVGTWLIGHAHAYAPIVPAVVIAVVIAVASVALKQETGQPSSRAQLG
jgi:uncharacterized membrane protein YoaK (UPF0700 family)